MSRPRKLPKDRRRHVRVVRLNDATLDVLSVAADQNQRSLSEEIEARLLASIAHPLLVDQLAERLYAKLRSDGLTAHSS